MKLDKKRVISVLAVAVFGLLVFLIGFRNGGAKPQEGTGPQEGGKRQEASGDAFWDLAAGAAKTVGKDGNAAIDFDALKARNGDIYAWIAIPGTAVDYPVVQKMYAEDPYDDYYLNHTADFVEGYPGAIYTQAVNAIDFTDSITVVYGHNMKDGSMFGGLHAFENKDFFDDNRTVLIYTPDYVFTYEIFAAVNFSDELLTYEYDFLNQEEVQRYLDDIKKCEGLFNDDIKVAKNDKLLTLSTCYSGQESRRLLVEAVLVEKRGSRE